MEKCNTITITITVTVTITITFTITITITITVPTIIHNQSQTTNKQQEIRDLVSAEIGILKTMRHPNIIRMQDYFEDADSISIVMDLLTDGDLYSQVCLYAFGVSSVYLSRGRERKRKRDGGP